MRHTRLRDALANFDAATHQFCQLVLRSLGVAGDTETGVTLVEDLGPLVAEVVDDLYLQRFGDSAEPPAINHSTALQIATKVVANPHTRLLPQEYTADSLEGVRVEFAHAVLQEMERRKRRLGILGYDDLLTRLAGTLEDADAPARDRMRRRWSVVMVDEFQDTDPVQWRVIDAAFNGHSNLVLIGDPKQAIYAFRGGDIETYLQAAATAGERRTLTTNWRSDQPLVDTLQVILGGAQLGHHDIVVHGVAAQHPGSRLAGAPTDAPFRLRVARRDLFSVAPLKTIGIESLRDHIARDLAADVSQLLTSEATYDGRPVQAGDVAVIVEAHKDARACREALAQAGISAVYAGDLDIFSSEAAKDWLCLLEAFAQPHRSGLVRAAATTMLFGETPASLHAGGDDLTDRVGQKLREWADHLRTRGVAAVFEAAQVAGLAQRVLAWRGGERHMTDLAHLAELLHQTAHIERFGLPALLEWLREECAGKGRVLARTRRLDSDAAAVQIMTVWASKGLQYPLVYLPFGFNRHVPDDELLLFHEDGARSLDIGGKSRPGHGANQNLWRAEVAGDDIRLTYVALTRAQSQVVAWWAPSWDERNGGISRLLRGRKQDVPVVPDSLDRAPSDEDVLIWLRRWQQAGGPIVEDAVVADLVTPLAEEQVDGLAVRSFSREVDITWRRTSYSGLTRAITQQAAGVASEPEETGLTDETVGPSPKVPEIGSSQALVSPMEGVPAGAAFGSLVHAVLEDADARAPDLHAELVSRVRDHLRLWPVDVTPDALAKSMLPLHDTPLGPLVPGLTLGDIGPGDRLRELEFEIPLAGGDQSMAADVRLAAVSPLLRTHLHPGDPLRAYADRLEQPLLGRQTLRGYVSGSIDAVLRLPYGDGHRFVVVDYKTNRLGDPESPATSDDYGPDQLSAAMLHSDYPLQALIYSVVLHRFLRWRLPTYDPESHLGGVLYLYLRGMCGVETPVVNGHPSGVFSWPVPATLVLALSDFLDGTAV